MTRFWKRTAPLALALLALSGPSALAQEGCGDPTPRVEAIPEPTPLPAPKAWDAGTAIGVVLDSDGTPATDDDGNTVQNGRMTAPQNQTEAEPATPFVRPGAELNLAVESATDSDHWVKNNPPENCLADEEGNEDDGITYSWEASGGTIDNPTSAGATWTAPTETGTYTITCTIDDTPTAVTEPETGERDDDSISRSCEVKVYGFSIEFIDTEVAAGGLSDEIHKARFKIIAQSGGENVPGVSVPTPEDVSANKDAPDTTNASVALDGSTTDNNGEVFGTLTSGNRLDTSTFQLNLNADDPDANPRSSVSQVWNTTGSGWGYPNTIEIGQAAEISYTVAYSRGAITSHNLHFRPTFIAGWEWFDDIGEDWDGDGEGDGDYDEVDYDEGEAGFSTWSSLINIIDQGENAGKYSAQMTVNDDSDDNFFVTEAGFGFSDETVRRQQEPTPAP